MKNKENKNITSSVEQVAIPLAESMGYRIWDVEFVKEGADKYLRITLDNDEGITIDDCEKFHRAIDPVLDELDPISESYILEVSSPGLEREIKSSTHVESCIGQTVEIRLYAPIDGAKQYTGELRGFDGDGRICIVCPSGDMAFEKEKIAKISTVYDFDAEN